MTRKEAIERSIELWTWLAETGKQKREWPEWEKYEEQRRHCFLCEYSLVEWNTGCSACPYYEQFGLCYAKNAPFNKWYLSKTIKASRKWATVFLAQLKELKP